MRNRRTVRANTSERTSISGWIHRGRAGSAMHGSRRRGPGPDTTSAMHPALLMALLIYCGMSILAVLGYAWDKRAAIAGRRRVPETTLHLIEALGGWPGALLARRIWRHKTIKPAYRMTLAVIIFLHLVGWMAAGWLMWR